MQQICRTGYKKLFENNDDLAGIVTSLINQYSNELEDYLNSKLVPQLNVILTRFSSSIFSSMLGLLVTAWNLLIGLIISVYLLVSKESFAGQSKRSYMQSGKRRQLIS